MILAIIGTGVALAALALGSAIVEQMNWAGNCIASSGSNC